MLKMKKGKLSGKEQEVYFFLESRDMTVFNLDDLVGLFMGNRNYLKSVLYRMKEKGWIRRVRRGVYTRVSASTAYLPGDFSEDPFLTVPKLYSDYYIGFYSALEILGLANQFLYTVYAVVPKQERGVDYGEYRIAPVRVKKELFRGSKTVKVKGQVLKVSNLEKTLADCFWKPKYSVSLGEVLRVISEADIKWKRFLDYLGNYDSDFLYQKVGYLLELGIGAGMEVPDYVLPFLEQRVSKNIFRLERGKAGGKYIRKWNIVDNIGEELLRW